MRVDELGRIDLGDAAPRHARHRRYGSAPASPQGARRMPISLSTIAISPAVTCSPEATRRRIRAHRAAARLVDPADQLVGLAGHGRHHDRDLVAGIDLALHMARGLADTLDIGDRRAAELHHDAGHDDACIPCEDK